MRRRNKVIFGIVGAVALIVTLPFLAILPWAASNATLAGWYLVFTKSPTLTELAGSYEAKPDWGGATLVLHHDGSFEESVSETGKAPRIITGRWTDISADGGHARAVTTSPYINVQGENYGQTYNSYRVNFYRKRFGSTFGVLNDDTGLQYIKTHD